MNTSNTPPFDFDVSRYGPLPRLPGLFVTGTDTEVGKTLVAGAIARCLARRGRRIEVMKPVATGCRRLAGQRVSEDAEFLAACADSRRTLAEIAPLRFAKPLVPNVAADLERTPVDLEAIFDSYRRLAAAFRGMGVSPMRPEGVSPSVLRIARNGGKPAAPMECGGNDAALANAPTDFKSPASADRSKVKYNTPSDAPEAVIVEGVGGLLCPISNDFWVIHLAKMMQLPLVIVTRAGLGAINHTLLTIQVARSAGLAVAGVVINRYHIDPAVTAGKTIDDLHTRGDIDLAMFTNPDQIAARGKVKILAIVPEEPANSVAQARIGPDTEFAIAQAPWEDILFQ